MLHWATSSKVSQDILHFFDFTEIIWRVFLLSDLSLSNPAQLYLLNILFPDKLQSFYLSPEGKRFQSLQTAKSWLISTIEAYERSDIIESPRKMRRTSYNGRTRVSIERISAEADSSNNSPRIDLTENSKRRRKSMAMRNPFRNLLKTTLNKNYKVEARKSQSKLRKHSIVNKLSRRRRLQPNANLAFTPKYNSTSIISRLRRREGVSC